MITFASIVLVIGLIVFPLFYHRSNSVISVEMLYGIVFGANYSNVSYEHTEDESKYYKEHVIQVHFLIFSITFSTLVKKSYKN